MEGPGRCEHTASWSRTSGRRPLVTHIWSEGNRDGRRRFWGCGCGTRRRGGSATSTSRDGVLRDDIPDAWDLYLRVLQCLVVGSEGVLDFELAQQWQQEDIPGRGRRIGAGMVTVRPGLLLVEACAAS